MLLGLHHPVKVWPRGRAVSLILSASKFSRSKVAGECLWEYMVHNRFDSCPPIFTKAGLSPIWSPALLERLVTNADGTTSCRGGIRVRVPVVLLNMGTIAQW